MSSLGMGLPSYNSYVGLCAFLFVRTKVKYYYIVSYHSVILITIRTNKIWYIRITIWYSDLHSLYVA